MENAIATKNEEVVESMAIEEVTNETSVMSIEDMQLQSFDDSDFEEVGGELGSGYWTPSEAGENKVVVFLGIDVREVLDKTTGEVKPLRQAIMATKEVTPETGSEKLIEISNGSVSLVSKFERHCNLGQVYRVTYKGKKKSGKTGNQYDDWGIVAMAKKVA